MTHHPDFGGILAMMPAFATADAAEYDATETIAVDELTRAVRAAIDDGVSLIATTGSFGESHTLLPEEWRTLVEATVAASGGRVPVIVGCPDVNARRALRMAVEAVDMGADGVLMGIPFYFPSTVDNATRFLREAGERIGDAALVFYHNPALHRFEMPPAAFGPLLEDVPNLVAMKDGNRDPRAFTELMNVADGRVSVFPSAWQYDAYRDLGAAGFWSYDVWMDPLPHVALLDAVDRGDHETARRLIVELYPSSSRPTTLSWRETANKLAIREAGYCDPGPLRPPFVEVPREVVEMSRQRARRWATVAERLRGEANGRSGS